SRTASSIGSSGAGWKGWPSKSEYEGPKKAKSSSFATLAANELRHMTYQRTRPPSKTRGNTKSPLLVCSCCKKGPRRSLTSERKVPSLIASQVSLLPSPKNCSSKVTTVRHTLRKTLGDFLQPRVDRYRRTETRWNDPSLCKSSSSNRSTNSDRLRFL